MNEYQTVEGSAPSGENQGNGLERVIDQALECLSALGSDYASEQSELKSLQQRLAEGRFHLAVLGQFKRGKSTLLNALLGDDLLPTDILPVTAIPTFIRSGETLQVEVFFDKERPAEALTPSMAMPLSTILADYVTEAGNPNNTRGVIRVEITHPSKLLRHGVVLIDTPGIGSTLRHNTEAALQALPQCDAALFLVSHDPPLTESELNFYDQFRERLPRIFFLLNKVDYLNENELRSSLRFLGDTLQSHSGFTEPPHIFPISARQGLEARLKKEDKGWKSSGMEEVEEHLVEFLAKEKKQTLQEALKRKTADAIDAAILQLQLTLSALTLPQEEMQKRLNQFSEVLPELKREHTAAADVLSGDLKRIVETLGTYIDGLKARVREAILPRIESFLETMEDTEAMERAVRSTMQSDIPVAFGPEMRRAAEEIREEAVKLLQLNQKRSDKIIEQVRQSAAELFQIPYQAPESTRAYIAFAAPSWSNEVMISDMDPWGQKISRKLFTKKYRHKRAIKYLRTQCNSLINGNVEQINWAPRRSLDESFRTFGADLKEQLQKTIDSTNQAIEIAISRRQSLTRDSGDEEARLRKALRTLQEIRKGI